MITLKKIRKKASEFKKHINDVRFFGSATNEFYFLDLPSNTKVRTYLNLIIRLNQTSGAERDIVIKFGFRKWILLSKWFSKIPNLYLSHPLRRYSASILVSHKKKAKIHIDFDYKKVTTASQYIDTVIPYIMHPSNYLGRDEIHFGEEKFSGIVSAGNFSEKIYNTDVLRRSFGLNNRWEIVNVLKSLKECAHVKGRQYMVDYSDKRYMANLVLIQRHTGGIPSRAWLETLSTFKFIFCAPGMTMPLCHNIFEAMRVGVVPITNYANWLNPSLEDGVNCLTYKNLDDIELVVKRALAFSDAEYFSMRSNTIRYFNEYYKDYNIAPGTYTLLNEDSRDL